MLGWPILAHAANLEPTDAIALLDRNIPRSPVTHPEAHIVQFYSQDDFLLHKLRHFLESALNSGNSVVVIATEEHCAQLATVLPDDVPDFSLAVAKGRYRALDANRTLDQLMINGLPDHDRFFSIVGGLVSIGTPGKVTTIFGEMVAVLWERGAKQAALQLERLWNELRKNHSISLLCGYRLPKFAALEDQPLFLEICAEHSHVIPDNVNGDPEEPRLRELARLQQRSNALENELQWRDREERFHRFVASVQDYALFMLDLNGYVTTWNPGAEKLKGYKPEEIVGRHFSCFYLDEDVRSGRPELNLSEAARHSRCEDEGWRLRKDGTRFWANVVITALHDDEGKLIGFGKVTRDFTERMEAQQALDRANRGLRNEMVERCLAEAKLAESEKSLRNLSLHLLRSQDEERRRIGRDLHDSLGQMLTAIKLSLQAIALPLEKSDPITRCIRLADDSIKEVRTISYLLYPPMLEELGLLSAIPWYLDGFGQRSGIRTTFVAMDEFDRLSRDLELALFRVLQEGLTNVHRHSGSTVAHVRLFTQEASSVLEIRDEGRGLPSQVIGLATAPHSPFAGVGLRGMNERLLQLNGRLELSSDDRGTTLRAIVPSDQR